MAEPKSKQDDLDPGNSKIRAPCFSPKVSPLAQINSLEASLAKET